MTESIFDRIDQEVLEDWIDGFLTPEESRRVAGMVSRDPVLQEMVRRLEMEADRLVSALEFTAETRPVRASTAAPVSLRHPFRRPSAFVAVGVAAALLLTALPVWFFAGGQTPADEWAPVEKNLLASVPHSEAPTIELESVEATAGETVFVTLRARRLEGFCGLEARVRLPEGLEAMSAQGEGMTYAGVRGGEIFVASISEDAWAADSGVILRLPIRVSPGAARQEFALVIDSLRLIDGQRRIRDVEKQNARIRVL